MFLEYDVADSEARVYGPNVKQVPLGGDVRQDSIVDLRGLASERSAADAVLTCLLLMGRN